MLARTAPGDGAEIAGVEGAPFEVSTTGAFTRLLRSLTRDESIGDRIVPIIPDEGRTFGMEALFKEGG